MFSYRELAAKEPSLWLLIDLRLQPSGA